MKLYLQVLLFTLVHYGLVSGQCPCSTYPAPTTSYGCPYATGAQSTSGGLIYDPSGGSSSTGGSDDEGVYDVLSPCSCSYVGGSSDSDDDDDDDDDDSNEDDDSDACSCQNSDPGCSCVLNCGCTTSGDNVCAEVGLINKTFTDIKNGGPYTILAIWSSDENDQIDNICYSYFSMPGTDNLLLYLTQTFIDGTYDVDSYIVSDEGPGVVLAGGADGMIKDKTFGDVPGCNANMVYRCHLWGDLVNPNTRGFKYATYVISPLCAQRNESCGEAAVQALEEAGYSQNYRILPRKLASNCVMSQNSTPVANTCAVPNYPYYY